METYLTTMGYSDGYSVQMDATKEVDSGSEREAANRGYAGHGRQVYAAPKSQERER